MSDPIDKQRAIVAAITHGQVNWTAEHRSALQAIMNKHPNAEYPAQIWKDIYRLLAVLSARLPKEEKKPS